jgi:hypothetical protein
VCASAISFIAYKSKHYDSAAAHAALTLIVDGWIGARSSFFHVKTIGLPPSARMATLPLPAVIL